MHGRIGNGHGAGPALPPDWSDMLRQVLATVRGNIMQAAEAQSEAMMQIAHRLLDLAGEQAVQICDLQRRVAELEAERPSRDHPHSEAPPSEPPP